MARALARIEEERPVRQKPPVKHKPRARSPAKHKTRARSPTKHKSTKKKSKSPRRKK
jgi:hypothetical protein